MNHTLTTLHIEALFRSVAAVALAPRRAISLQRYNSAPLLLRKIIRGCLGISGVLAIDPATNRGSRALATGPSFCRSRVVGQYSAELVACAGGREEVCARRMDVASEEMEPQDDG